MPILKLGDIQLLEIFFLLHIAFLGMVLILRGLRFRVNHLWRVIGVQHGLFLLLTLLLALASLRLTFYPLSETSLLKTPIVLSAARVTEISLGAFYMLYIASILRSDPKNLTYALKIYFWTGVVSASYSLLSYPVLIAAKLELGAYGDDYRTRGFFNEGGPYGLFLVSILIVGCLLYKRRFLSLRQTLFCAPALLAAFVASQSKAAYVACCILVLLVVITIGTVRQKLLLVALTAGLTIAVLVTTPAYTQLKGYIFAYQLVTETGGSVNDSAYTDLGGRLAGAILVPRMITAHPWIGIGFGNYPLMRNDPNYLQGLPPYDSWDLAAIGLLSYVPELGIPLFTYLMLILCLPAWILRRARASTLVVLLATYQPLSHMFGVQLNFYYPWVCTALALGTLPVSTAFGRCEKKFHVLRRHETPSEIEGSQQIVSPETG